MAKSVAVLLALVLVVAVPAAAQTTSETKKRLEDLKLTIADVEGRRAQFEAQAEDAQKAAATLSEQMVAQGRLITRTEGALERLQLRIDDLRAAEREKRGTLKDQRSDMVQLIASMERLSRRPAILSLVQPTTALTTVRSVSVMSNMVPQINTRAETLRVELEELAKIEDQLIIEQLSFDERLTRLASEQAEMDRLVAVRRDEAEGATAQAIREGRRLERLAEEAIDLEALLSQLLQRAPRPRPERRPGGSARPAKPPARAPITGVPSTGFAGVKGRLLFPVVSSRVVGFGDKDGNITAQGLRGQTRPGAQVRSPYDGQIVFAGQFRRYGEILIIDHGDGYHSLLAGMERLYADRGKLVLAGEPVGTMARDRAETNFYYELRHQGEAIDPEPWFQVQTAASE